MLFFIDLEENCGATCQGAKHRRYFHPSYPAYYQAYRGANSHVYQQAADMIDISFL